jgi:signal transduction histidine kinase
VFDLETPHAQLGLAGAIRETASHVFLDRTPVWEVEVDQQVLLADGQLGQALRIIKEALINVRKHAHASRVRISSSHAGDGMQFRVADDGVGFDPDQSAPPAGHRGLVTMRERAELSGGWLRAGRVAGGGAEVVFWLPGEEPDEVLPA